MLHLFYNRLANFSLPQSIFGTIYVLSEVLHILDLLYNTVKWNIALLLGIKKV